MRPRETPHTSTPIAGAQTSQAHTLSQDHEPHASCSLSSRLAAQCRGLPSCPPCGWHREPACSAGCQPAVEGAAGILELWGGCNAAMEQRLWPSLPACCRLTLC